MKKLLLSLLIIPILIQIQGQSSNWNLSNSKQDRAFIENKGQFDGKNEQSNNKIEYATKQGSCYTFFSKKGITYRFEKLIRNPKKKEGDHITPSRVHKSEFINILFLNANTNVQIINGEKTDHYYTYSAKSFDKKNSESRNHINGFKKITYKNIYDNIDIEYTFHPKGGIKYNVILHPGANPSQIKMKYESSHTNHTDENINISLSTQGQIEISTSQGTITEHKPFTFYSSSNENISSNYIFNNNVLSFKLQSYDNTKKVIIDPWVVSPAFDDGDFAREVETDAAGNVFVIGGETPMQLRKYTAAGALVWTYNTPWDTTGGDWLGTLATDAAGVSYVTQGVGAEIERVNDLGATFSVMWHTNGPALSSTEYWTITFNCDNTRLIVGGTGGSLFTFEGKIYDIDLATGNVATDLTVGVQSGFTPVEVRSIAPTKNSKYVYLTHNEVGLVNQNLTSCSAAPDFENDNTHNLSYKCENYLSAAQNGGGLKALIANDDYFYTHKGDEILQWDISTGALINTASLPGGNSNNGFGGLVVHCNGLDVDVNGNVYAGSMGRVVKFDQNLNVISSSNTTDGFTVYDVSVSNSGEVLAVGALLNNGAPGGRGSRIESIDMTAGGQYATVCCDPNFCPIDPLCNDGSPVNLSSNTPGGTWSSVPATTGLNSTTGVFDPSVAGIGSYLITYTLPCGTNTETIIVGDCSAMSVCVEPNGDFTVSGGTGPYTWAEMDILTSNDCATCGGIELLGFCNVSLPCNVGPGFVDFATGITITPNVGADTIQITDDLGNTLIVNDVSILPQCNPVCDASFTLSDFCVGETNAASNIGTSGGTFAFNPAPTDGATINSSTATISNGIAGTTYTIEYTISTDGGCSTTQTVTVNAADDASFTLTDFCVGQTNAASGITTPGGTFIFNPAPTDGANLDGNSGQITSGVSGATYTLEYTTPAGPCQNSSTQSVTVNAADDASFTLTNFCAGQANAASGITTPGGTFTFNPVPSDGAAVDGTSGEISSGVSGTTYTLEYTTPTGSCQNSSTQTVTVNAADDASFTLTNFCVGQTNAASGISTPGGTFAFNPVPTDGATLDVSLGQITNGVSGATYTLEYTTPAGPCQNSSTQTVTVTAADDASFTLTDFCVGQTNSASGITTPGGSFAFNPVPADGATVNATSGEITNGVAGTTYTLEYTTSGSCSGTSSQTVTVTALDDPTFSYASNTMCLSGGNQTPVSVTTSGGTFGEITSNGLVIDPITGIIDVVSSGINSYDVFYTTPSPCSATSIITIVITSTPDATFNYSGPYCQNDGTATVTFGTNASAGAFTYTTAPGLSLNATNGEVNLAVCTPGTYNVTNFIAAAGGCSSATSDATITINATDDATFILTNYCEDDVNSATGIVTAGGTFSFDQIVSNGESINTATGEITDGVAGSTYTLEYLTNGICPDSTTQSVTVVAPPFAGTNVTLDFCNGDPTVSLLTSIGGTNLTGTWSGPSILANGATGTFDPSLNASGNYTYTVLGNGICPDATATVSVTVGNPMASFTASPNSGSAPLEVDFTNTSSGAIAFAWNLGEGTLPSNTDEQTTYTTNGDYTVTLTATDGSCVDVATTIITVSDEVVIIIPNIFTPNGDNTNDQFKVRAENISDYSCQLFNRWGQKLFETNNINVSWDGKTNAGIESPDGTYYYIIKITPISGEEKIYNGFVTLQK